MKRRHWCITLLGTSAVAMAGGTLASQAHDAAAPADVGVHVAGPLGVPPIAAGFLGVSTEYDWAADLAGAPRKPDVVLERLIRQLTPGQAPVLRIGGDSSDHTWWPVRGLDYPDSAAFALTPAWLASVRAFAQALHAHLILGLNLESNNRRLVDAEATALLNGIGRRRIQSLEIGNEPNLYHSIRWYRTPEGTAVRGRGPGYDDRAYLSDFARITRGLPSLPLSGPALGQVVWMRHVLRPLLRRSPRLRDITFHRYPLNRCFTKPGTPQYPTIANLLSPLASRGLAATVAPFARLARQRHDAFRVDELGSVACHGKPGISDTFASALWALDTLFAMARQGVTGVNIHTFPYAAYRLFSVAYAGGRWSAAVAPEYYGLLLFARAAPPGSRLLRATVSGTVAVRVWAMSGPGRGRSIRVVMINDDTARSHMVQVDLARAAGPATLERLVAFGAAARSGVTLAGQSFGASTTTGRLTGRRAVQTVSPTGQGYQVMLPPASAALLTAPG